MTLCCKVLQRNSAASISSRAQTTGGNFVFGPTPPQTGDILMSTQGIIMTPPRRVLRMDAERIARSSAAPSAVMAYSGHHWDPYSACVAAGRRQNRALIGGTVGSDGGHHWDPYSACVAAGRRTHHAPIGGAIGSDAASITEYSQGRCQTNRVLIGGAVGSDASSLRTPARRVWRSDAKRIVCSSAAPSGVMQRQTNRVLIGGAVGSDAVGSGRGPLWKLRDVNDDEAAVVVVGSGRVQEHSLVRDHHIDPLRSDTAGSRLFKTASNHSDRLHLVIGFQGTTLASDWPEKQLRALRHPHPDGLDDFFHAASDPDDDFMAAFQRAVVFTVDLGETRVAHMWRQALKIGFRAGSGGATEGARNREASEDYAAGREAGLKEGRTAGLRDGKQDGRKAGKLQGLKEGEILGFEKGKLEGLSEGKRLGFVAGREFGEKQAAKLSKTPAPDRVLVDVGTDSPTFAPATSPTPPDVVAAAALTQADPPIADEPSSSPKITPLLGWENDSISLISPGLSFRWADEAHPVLRSPGLPLPSRDFSALRSDAAPAPFSTLQRRVHRKHKTTRAPPSATWQPTRFRRHPASTWPTPRSANSPRALDWDHDPRLSDLTQVLCSMGWRRGGGRGRRGSFAQRYRRIQALQDGIQPF
ncbi:hypothetical protein C8F04DRAFT_1321531 [Mycena alexandri]|uniref:Uncharacterized protein n=1 Tax=Mycena alexandri TaxID=1745969 RepID=A0AAD6T424_9AGAR|nr:hypothetical protein C8F04DRAFT_1321531 [Mycena alexandri]